MKKYRIATNTYPYVTIIAEGFATEAAAVSYAMKLASSWCFGRYGWHVESY